MDCFKLYFKRFYLFVSKDSAGKSNLKTFLWDKIKNDQLIMKFPITYLFFCIPAGLVSSLKEHNVLIKAKVILS